MKKPLEIIHNGTATTDQVRTYLHLPFDVPEGIERIDVQYEYSEAIGAEPHLTGGNTVDIGLFDPRGVGFMAEGFRGWSGSERRAFFVAPDDATPGYLPGPIWPGTWHVHLGFYKVAAAGCDYTVTVRLTPAKSAHVEARFPALLRLGDQASRRPLKLDGWYKGELHCHSLHSDGDSSPYEVIQAAEALGLDFIALTDHNVMSHQAALKTLDTGLILIPGYEVTTYRGHWNIWGDQGWIDFRMMTDGQMREAIQEAKRRGYLVSCNHPRPFGPPWEFEDVEAYHCIEIWNGPWRLMNNAALAFWESRLKAGKRFVAVGGSDAHFLKREHLHRLGHPTTYVRCDGPPSAKGLLDGIRAGRVFVTEAPDGPQLYFGSGDRIMGETVVRPQDDKLSVWIQAINAAGTTLELHGAPGCLYRCAIDTASQRLEVQLPTDQTSYVRAQLVTRESDECILHAAGNPIYLQDQAR
ncbi:MAG: PHP domain-containing protein [Anaerolineae bacterium]|nr:PHP domain-containing protein [Anaerolineae bacterium]